MVRNGTIAPRSEATVKAASITNRSRSSGRKERDAPVSAPKAAARTRKDWNSEADCHVSHCR